MMCMISNNVRITEAEPPVLIAAFTLHNHMID